MGKKRHNVIPLFSTRATATVSVAMVLFLLGLSAFLGVAAHSIGESIRESMGFVIILNDDVTASDTDALRRRLDSSEYVAECRYSSKDVVLERWQKMVGEDEDIVALAGINPFRAEFEVHVKAAYASPDSIEAIIAPLLLRPEINDIEPHTSMAGKIDSMYEKVTIVLLAVAVALLIISFVLIANTIRLTVYSRRFAIHTMKLVGATAGFIRRPFLTSNVVNGIVAGIIASALLVGMFFYARSVDPVVDELISPIAIAAVTAGVIATGILICLIAAFWATNKYLRQSYDEMFR